MIIETKFSNGDSVFYATIGETYTKIDCEECAGKGRLKIEGKSYTVACRNCGGRGNFSKREATPAARKLTIGQVRIELTDSPGTANQWGDVLSTDGNGFTNYSPVQKREEAYMCIETGLGSGSVYPVDDLFYTEAEALDRATWKIVEWRERVAEEATRQEQERLRNAREFEDEESDALQTQEQV
jgi:hypothetical protein